jgi:hypothetical protein
VTKPARITQADMERAVRAAAAVDGANRVVFDLEACTIEIFIGDPVQPRPVADKSVWSDDDV